MAVERTTINGDFSALKTALETLVPAFFGSVELSGDTYTLTCKDGDGNTLLAITRSSNNAVWNVAGYRTASSYLATSGSSGGAVVNYFYNMGANGAFLACAGKTAIAIAKAADGRTAVVFPTTNSGTEVVQCSAIYATCWGDDTAFTNAVRITDSTTPTLGNNCLFVPVPLFGDYQTPNNIPKVYMLPVAQTNMRGITQEVTSDAGTFMTNGYLAMKYDAGGAA